MRPVHVSDSVHETVRQDSYCLAFHFDLTFISLCSAYSRPQLVSREPESFKALNHPCASDNDSNAAIGANTGEHRGSTGGTGASLER
jgi:hypothetical protein